MTQNIKYIGETGNDIIATLLLRGKRLFTYKDAVQIYSNEPNLREVLSSLVKAGWLQRIEKGKYLILPLEAGSTGQWTEPEFVVASLLIQPYYIGLQSALNYYGYSEKVSNTVYIVSPRRKFKPYINISGVKYQFIKLQDSKFFGFTQLFVDSQPINLSEREKTIIDCLYLQSYVDGIAIVAQALWYGREELDFSKLAEYAVRYGNKAVCQRLGYLFEVLNINKRKALSILLTNVSNSYARLDTLLPATGKYVSKWKLRVNVPEKELLQWRFD